MEVIKELSCYALQMAVFVTYRVTQDSFKDILKPKFVVLLFDILKPHL